MTIFRFLSQNINLLNLHQKTLLMHKLQISKETKSNEFKKKKRLAKINFYRFYPSHNNKNLKNLPKDFKWSPFPTWPFAT